MHHDFDIRTGRRGFLRGSLAALGATALQPALLASPRRDDDVQPTLVVIQLAGGNDGLNTIVPFQNDAYYAARKRLGVDAKKVLPLDDERGFHPKLGGLRKLWDAGELAIVEGVGYANPNRSHFSSFDIWHAADEMGKVAAEGWMARLAQAIRRGDERDVVSAVHVGERLPYSLFSSEMSGLCFNDPSLYRWNANEQPIVDAAGAAMGRGPSTLSRVRSRFHEAKSSSEIVRKAAADYRTKTEYPDSTLANALHVCAALIRQRIGSRILSVELAGFDTHAKQPNMHEYLLDTWDSSMAAFLDDLRGTPEGEQTVVMVFSEFGRRVAENASNGTDHGTAGPVFVAGPAVRGGLYGAPSTLDELDAGDLIYTTDFRSVYATLIEDGFGVDATALLGKSYPKLPFLA